MQFIINKYQSAVDQFWLTDWQTGTISDWPTADHVQQFAATSFSLLQLQQLCTVGRWIFLYSELWTWVPGIVFCFVLFFWLTVYVQTQMSTLSRRHTTYVSNNVRSYHRWTRATRCLTHVVLYTDVLFELSWQHIATIDDVLWRNSVSLEFGTKFQRKVVP